MDTLIVYFDLTEWVLAECVMGISINVTVIEIKCHVTSREFACVASLKSS